MIRPQDIRVILRKLDGKSADALESETLEFKSWLPAGGAGRRGFPGAAARERRVRKLRETVVCFANARGGLIVLGVTDRQKTRASAIHGVGDLDAEVLRRSIYEGTEPRILVEIVEVVEPEGRILVIRVPRGMPPHTTSEGVGKIRVGKECKPLTGSSLAQLLLGGGQTDLTAQIVSGTVRSLIDPGALAELRQRIESGAAGPELGRLPDEDLLAALDLVRDGEVTLAAVLLLGRRRALSRHVPRHEVSFLRYRNRTRIADRRDLRGPILSVLDEVRGLLDAHLRIGGVETSGFDEMSVPELTWWAAREAVLNAVVHRDYFLGQSILVELRPDRLEISSPGGFVGGVTPDNVLRHPPVRRNPLLAQACQRIDLVNRAGVGVDRIFEELLRLGKGFPGYHADEAHVMLSLPIRTHAPFVRFVYREKRKGRPPELDDLILFWALATRGELDRWSAAPILQLDESAAAERLISLRRRGYVVPRGRGRGTSYRISPAHPDLLASPEEAVGDPILDEDAVRVRILSALDQRHRLTNGDVRRLTGRTRSEVLAIMRGLRARGWVRLEGRGRGAHYVPTGKSSG